MGVKTLIVQQSLGAKIMIKYIVGSAFIISLLATIGIMLIFVESNDVSQEDIRELINYFGITIISFVALIGSVVSEIKQEIAKLKA